MKDLRNFCIIAHIDHGKSTLADRLLEATRTIQAQDAPAQVLDDMELERERGITIKSRAIQMHYTHQGTPYTLNLIDTPGHVDFAYEVSRSMAACEGALLVVDASQGIEAQTLATLYQALEQGLSIIPVLNKIDLPHARADEVAEELVSLLGGTPEDIIHASAKQGLGIQAILAAIVERIPSPQGNPQAPLQALVFDAVYNPFKGVEVLFKITNGTLHTQDPIRFLRAAKTYRVEELGILTLQPQKRPTLEAGQVGYLTAHIKQASDVQIGDTLTQAHQPCSEAIQGFAAIKPMVFAGIYPTVSSAYEELRSALEKLQLNDASLVWEVETSAALGFGFRCGFLGLLHMEIVQERLRREFAIDVITTVPSVQFHVIDKKGVTHPIHAPSQMPPANQIDHIQEPHMRVQLITKATYVGPLIALCIDKRGVLQAQHYLTTDRVELSFDMPLVEIAFDFFDKLKSLSKGYASFDYSLLGFVPGDLVKLDILLNAEKVDALSAIVHRSKAYSWGQKLCTKLKTILSRHQFDIPIQAAIGSKIIARETVKAVRKDVTAKLYGGDVTRKKKLLAKQKQGKKRMRQIGKVQVPQEAFLALLKMD